jgi:hypothetical protein
MKPLSNVMGESWVFGMTVGGMIAVIGCGASPSVPASAGHDSKLSPSAQTVAAKADIPNVSEQQREELIADLSDRIKQTENNLDKLVKLEATARVMGQSASRPKQKTDLEEQEQSANSARQEIVKQLVGFRAIRHLASTDANRVKELVDRIIDRCREKHLPMYERSLVAEKIADRANKPALQIARDVSSKVVFGWYERYDVEWMIKDAESFTKQRVEEIADGLGSSPKAR